VCEQYMALVEEGMPATHIHGFAAGLSQRARRQAGRTSTT